MGSTRDTVFSRWRTFSRTEHNIIQGIKNIVTNKNNICTVASQVSILPSGIMVSEPGFKSSKDGTEKGIICLSGWVYASLVWQVTHCCTAVRGSVPTAVTREHKCRKDTCILSLSSNPAQSKSTMTGQ